MKNSFYLLVALLLSVGAHAQKTVRMDAVKGNDFGVTYVLPKTALDITINYTKTTRTAGEFYMYAERYLSISNPIIESTVEYQFDNIDAQTVGVPNKLYTYLVEFRSNSAAAYLTLTEDGMICAINGEYTFPKKEGVAKKDKPKSKGLNARQYFSEEILRAGSTAKQAELVAKQIYRLRASRTDILTGDADNMPPDGDAYRLVMQQIDEQEQALTALFVGSEVKEPLTKNLKIEPGEKDIDETIIARFSQKLGVVEANDLAGEAIYLSLKAVNPNKGLFLSVKEAAEREKKFSKGIIYNIPEKGTLRLEFKDKVYVDKVCDVVQFGTQDVLDHKQFGDRNNPLKVIFYPELGAIKQTGIAQ